jgi:uncharacterized protein (TIGR02453 family)
LSRAIATSSGFTGFPDVVFDFLGGLEKDNSREYWERNKPTWTGVIQPSVDALLADLAPQFGPLRTFRPNRDIRFSTDKSPYKTWIGVTTTDLSVGGVGSFLRVDSTGMRVACGAMAFASDQVKEFRRALDDPASAREFDEVRDGLLDRGYIVGPGSQPTLQRPPAGFAPDHPHAECLRWKGAVVIAEFHRAGWMASHDALDQISQVWTAGAPLVAWIQRHVGATASLPRKQQAHRP